MRALYTISPFCSSLNSTRFGKKDGLYAAFSAAFMPVGHLSQPKKIPFFMTNSHYWLEVSSKMSYSRENP
jgi:hypothetical protein